MKFACALRNFIVLVFATVLLLVIDTSSAEENGYGPAQFALMAHHHIKESAGHLNNTIVDSMDKAAEAIAKSDKRTRGKGGKQGKEGKAGKGHHGKEEHHRSDESQGLGTKKQHIEETVAKAVPNVENKKSQDVHGEGCVSGSASNPSEFDWSKYAGMGGQKANSGSSSGGAGGFDWSKYVPGAGGNGEDNKDSDEKGPMQKRTRSKHHDNVPPTYDNMFDDDSDNMPKDEVASSAESIAKTAEDLAYKLLVAAGNLREAANRLKHQSELQDSAETLESADNDSNDQIVNTGSTHSVQNTVVSGSGGSPLFTSFLVTVTILGGIGFSMYWFDRKRRSSYEAV